MKFLFAIFLILSITGCGVNSSSGANASSYDDGNNNNGGDNGSTDGDDGNITSPGDDNITSPDDGNITSPDDGNTTSPGDGDPLPDPADSIFDTTGDVVYDANACDGNSYRIASDASYNGDSLSENGSNFFIVDGEGLNIRSEHVESSPSNASKTFVYLFYKTFPTKGDLGVQGTSSYLHEGFFFLTYDNAWTDGSIPGVDNTVYVQSTQTEKPTCNRLILNSIGEQVADLQKVYR